VTSEDTGIANGLGAVLSRQAIAPRHTRRGAPKIKEAA
jgi:hypothetical protein